MMFGKTELKKRNERNEKTLMGLQRLQSHVILWSDHFRDLRDLRDPRDKCGNAVHTCPLPTPVHLISFLSHLISPQPNSTSYIHEPLKFLTDETSFAYVAVNETPCSRVSYSCSTLPLKKKPFPSRSNQLEWPRRSRVEAWLRRRGKEERRDEFARSLVYLADLCR